MAPAAAAESFVVPGAITFVSTLDTTSGDGRVAICALEVKGVAIPSLDGRGLALLALLLSGLALALLRRAG